MKDSQPVDPHDYRVPDVFGGSRQTYLGVPGCYRTNCGEHFQVMWDWDVVQVTDNDIMRYRRC